MISLHYKLSSYHHFLSQVAELLGTTVQDHQLKIPPHIGEGYFKVTSFGEDLEALTYDVQLKEELLFTREKEGVEFYNLVFDRLDVAGSASVNIGVDTEPPGPGRNTAMYLTSFLYDVAYVLEKDAPLKGVRILLSAEWMKKYLQLSERENVLAKYLSLKNLGVWQMPVDAELTQLMNDVLSPEEVPLLFFQNKVMQIIEKFFSWLYNQEAWHSNAVGITRVDIEQAQKAEAILTNDITVLPPTIKTLARGLAVSESKLKKLFKTVYGLPPYEYYQKQRMQKARVMLLSGEYSIKDVGYTLGYSNLSNFTLAFKKEFKALPSDITKRRLR